MTTTNSDERPPRAPWWRHPLTAAAVAAAVVVAVIVWALVASGESDQRADGDPTSTASTATTSPPPPVSTSLATPSKKPPTPTATAPSTALPKPVRADLDETATAGTGVTVSVSAVQKVTSQAQGVGEIAGPAIRFTVRVENDTEEALSMGNVVVNTYYGKDRTPAASASGPGAKPFGATIAAGGTGEGTFVFNVPASGLDRVLIEFIYSIDAPKVLFSGSVA